MKFFLYFLTIWSFVSFAHADIEEDTALETGSIKVEFFETSGKGVIHVLDCDQCLKQFYTFSDQPRIKRKGSYIPFEVFMKDYWNAKNPTIFLDKQSRSVLKVSY